jgi:hypothetical protein
LTTSFPAGDGSGDWDGAAVAVEAGVVAVGAALAVTIGVELAALEPAADLAAPPAQADSSMVKAIKVKLAFLIINSSLLEMPYLYHFTTNSKRFTPFFSCKMNEWTYVKRCTLYKS